MGKKTIHGGLIIRGTLASGAGDDLLTIDATTGEVGKISGTPLTTTLTAGSIFVGNASNVATATAVTGDVTINSSGVTAITSGVIVNADINATAAIAVSKLAALTVSRAVVSDASGFISASAVTSTELGYVSGVTSAIQTQINSKQATITGGATTITSTDLTANRALISGTLGKVEVSAVTTTELGYLTGVTSAIQTQFSGKLSATITGAATGDIIYYNGTNWVNLPRGTNGQTLQSTAATIQWAAATANGLPIGGTTNQVLSKNSGTDFDAGWSTLTVSRITDLTALPADINTLAGANAAGLTATHLSYLVGVTSNIQSQLGNKLGTALPQHSIWVGNVSNQAASLPAGTNGQVLTISSGAPTWVTSSSTGVTGVGALDGTTKSANAAAIVGANIFMQTADGTNPGVVSTGTQTFAGVKTFNNNVGIGTSPTVPLHFANGTIARKIVLHGSNNDHQFRGFGTASPAGTDVVRYQSDDVTVDHVFYAASSATASNELMRITGTGSVGIGGTPSYALDVLYGANPTIATRTSGTGSPGVFIQRTGGTASASYFYLPTDVNELRLQNNGTDRFYFAGDKLGIGKTPTYKLDIYNSASSDVVRLQGNSATVDSDQYLINLAGNQFTLYNVSTSTNARLTLAGTAAGILAGSATTNASINVLTLESQSTGTPANGIGVGVSFRAETTSDNIETGGTLECVASDVTALSEDFDFVMKLMVAGATATEKFRFASTGIGTATDWLATSDRRIKNNISKVSTDVLTEITKIGELFSSYERAGKNERGFIAQELLEVAPEYVTVPEDPSQMMAVNYSKMTALLFKGFQQLLQK